MRSILRTALGLACALLIGVAIELSVSAAYPQLPALSRTIFTGLGIGIIGLAIGSLRDDGILHS